MTLGFFTVFRKDPIHYVSAERMLASAKDAMPGLECVQFTDAKSPLVYGADRLVRRPHGKILERRLEHYADCAGEWLLVDTDVVIQRDVRHVFDDDWDVALTDRQWRHLKQPADFMRDMPFNTGVCFSRSPEFWRAVLMTWRSFPFEQQSDWLSEQRAVADVVRKDVFTVKVLPGMIYNYPPTTEDDAGLKDAAIVHLKGGRKSMRVAS